MTQQTNPNQSPNNSQNSRVKDRTRDIIVGCVIALLGVLIYFTVEPYEDTQFRYWSPEAEQIKFLAMQKHLASFDYEVVLANNIYLLFSETALNPLLPGPNDVIIFSESELQYNSELTRKTLQWIEHGGHAVIDLRSSEGVSTFSTNQLLNSFGIQTQWLEDDRFEKLDYNVTTSVNTTLFGELAVNVDDRIFIELQSDSNAIAYSASVFADLHTTHPTILQLAYGDGLVTLMTDVLVFNNKQLRDKDNILWLHSLIEGANQIFVFSYRDPLMWYQIIYDYSPSFYWILLVSLLICLWFVAIRFGTVKHINSNVVTYFSQHISAAGEFYWANKQHQRLVNNVRQQIKDELRLRLSLPNLDEKQTIEALAKLSLWPNETIHQLMYKNHPHSKAQFTNTMQGLQQLRKMI